LDAEVMAATQMTFLSLSPTSVGHEVVAGGCDPCDWWKRAQIIDPTSPPSKSRKMYLKKSTDSITGHSPEDGENAAARALYQTQGQE
jgi:hypothetical protein